MNLIMPTSFPCFQYLKLRRCHQINCCQVDAPRRIKPSMHLLPYIPTLTLDLPRLAPKSKYLQTNARHHSPKFRVNFHRDAESRVFPEKFSPVAASNHDVTRHVLYAGLTITRLMPNQNHNNSVNNNRWRRSRNHSHSRGIP